MFERKTSVRALIVTFGLALWAGPFFALAAERPTFWPYQCVDTMKYSRDAAREWGSRKDLGQLVAVQVDRVVQTGANCISLGTPYEREFVPVLSEWVKAARARGLKVWFRGNTASWEGWFGFARYQDPSQHHRDVARFVGENPGLFEPGDIFTPAPEAENGSLGSPWKSKDSAQKLRDFLVASYGSCKQAFAGIGKAVTCGYYSTNGDVARDILTGDTLAKIGGVLAVDHYVKSPEQVVKDAVAWAGQDRALAALGEFGAPIPDIHGTMTDQQQAEYLDRLLSEAVRHRGQVAAVNYWVSQGGSTAVFTERGEPKAAVEVLRKYFRPSAVDGLIVSSSGEPLPNVTVRAVGGAEERAVTDGQGRFRLVLVAGERELTVETGGYRGRRTTLSLAPEQVLYQQFELEPGNRSLGYWLKRLWQKFSL